MSEVGYGKHYCAVKISEECEGKNAGYERRPEYAQQGPWLSACEPCARVPYKQPQQFQEDVSDGF